MSQETHPAYSPERVAFRERFNVRLVTEKEEGSHIENMPEGVYGFTCSPASEELPLFIKPIYQCTEIHKLAGGEVCYIGYVTSREYETLQRGMEPATVNLYPEPYGESTKLVSVPHSRVDRKRLPTREEGNAMKMEIAPRPEFLGTASAVN
jgi:hypothetical protein